MARASTWAVRVVVGALVIILVLVVAAVGYLLGLKVPQSASGMAAKAVCSGVFVAGRDPDVVFDEDVAGASPAFAVVSVRVDEASHSATAKTLGLFSRTASLQSDRGCVLDVEPDPTAKAYVPTSDLTRTWPEGDAPAPEQEWPEGVDAARLDEVVDAAFEGAGDVADANARAVAIVQNGTLLVLREAPGFEDGTPLHGWSMTKTVAGMLAYKLMVDNDIPLDTPVVDTFPNGRGPEWVTDWRTDDRAAITVADLIDMTDGLDNTEGYTPLDDTVRMLNSEPDMAAYSAQAPSAYPAGTHWNYTSQTANILADVARGQVGSDEAYWTYPSQALFDPIGARSATLETDTSGTWVGSSYLWASVADWARLGQLALQDGEWNGTQVIPPGWLELASTPALPDGEAAGYSAQAWLPGNPVGGECRALAGFPEDTVSMEGHWGQKVAVVPSKQAVVVRLGWTFDSDTFDYCEFWNDVLTALPDAPTAASSPQP